MPRPALVHPEVVLALSPAVLRALAARFGAPRGTTAKSPPMVIARAAFCDDAPAAFVDAFATIARFAHAHGGDAVCEGAHAVGHPIDAQTRDDAPADIVARLLLDDGGTGTRGRNARGHGATKKSAPSWAARALARARIRVDRAFVPVASYELAAAHVEHAARAPKGAAKECEARVRAAYGESFRAYWETVDDRGRLHAAILYVAPAFAEPVWAGKASARVAYRPLRADIVRIDDAAARFRLTTARPQHLLPLREAFGAARHGDPEFYSLRPSMSFKELQEMGAAGFAARRLPKRIAAWDVVGLQWDSGDGARHETRAPSSLAKMEAHVHVAGGYFSRATFRTVPDAATHPVDVFMQLPHRITVSDARFDDEARAAVGSLGCFVPGVLGDDICTLEPWVHPEWRWREVLGDAAFDELVRAKLLVRVKTKGLASPEYRPLGRSVKVNPVPGEPGVSYATPEDFSFRAADVREAEGEMWKLDVDALRAWQRRELGLAPVEPEERASIAGVEDVGVLPVKRGGRVRVFQQMTRARDGMIAAVRVACRAGETPVLLVPRGRAAREKGILQVELDLAQQFGLGDVGRVMGTIAVALKIEGEIDLWRLATREQVLVIEQRRQRVWLLGVLLKSLSDQGYRFFLGLAHADGAVVHGKDLGLIVAPDAFYPDVVVRKARARLPGVLAASFAAAGKELPKGLLDRVIVLEGRGGYRLGVSALVV